MSSVCGEVEDGAGCDDEFVGGKGESGYQGLKYVGVPFDPFRKFDERRINSCGRKRDLALYATPRT